MSGGQGRAEESGCAENSGRWHRPFQISGLFLPPQRRLKLPFPWIILDVVPDQRLIRRYSDRPTADAGAERFSPDSQKNPLRRVVPSLAVAMFQILLSTPVCLTEKTLISFS